MQTMCFNIVLLFTLMFLSCINAEEVAGQSTECQRKCNNDTQEPICASNGQVYESECLMLKANCSLTSVDWELCRGLHPLCPADCLDIQDPVCSDDGKIHPNKCVMHNRNCGVKISERPIIFCLGSHRKSRHQEKCPEQCLELYKPVCGSDGQIYLNECYLQMENCRNGVEKMDMSECVSPSSCPTSCIPIYDPVCGSNRKVYLNQCTMQKENCKSPVKKMPLQFCVGDNVDKL